MDFYEILIVATCFCTVVVFLFIDRSLYNRKKIKKAHQKEDERKESEARSKEIEIMNRTLAKKRFLEAKQNETFSLNKNVKNVIVTRMPELMRVFQEYSNLTGIDCHIIGANMTEMNFVSHAQSIPFKFLDELDSYPKETHFYFGTHFGYSNYTGLDLVKIVKEQLPESKNYMISVIERNAEHEEMMFTRVLDHYFDVDAVIHHLWNEIGMEMRFQERSVAAALKEKREIPVSSL
jgi:hypothetical protein